MGPTFSRPGGGGRAVVGVVAPPLSASARTRLAGGTQTGRGPETVSRLPAGASCRIDARGRGGQCWLARRPSLRGSQVPRGDAGWAVALGGYGPTPTIAVGYRSDQLVSGAGHLRGGAECPRHGATSAARRACGVRCRVSGARTGTHTAVPADARAGVSRRGDGPGIDLCGKSAAVVIDARGRTVRPGARARRSRAIRARAADHPRTAGSVWFSGVINGRG